MANPELGRAIFLKALDMISPEERPYGRQRCLERIVRHSYEASLARSDEAVVYIRCFEKQLRCSREGFTFQPGERLSECARSSGSYPSVSDSLAICSAAGPVETASEYIDDESAWLDLTDPRRSGCGEIGSIKWQPVPFYASSHTWKSLCDSNIPTRSATTNILTKSLKSLKTAPEYCYPCLRSKVLPMSPSGQR